MGEEKILKKFMRPVRSFVLRQGRLTKSQAIALKNEWPVYGLNGGEGGLDFKEIFGNNSSVTLEIGFGDGVSLASMAAQSPEKNFLGIEVHRPGVGRLLHLIKVNGLTNIRVMDEDAVEIIQNRVQKNSLDRVQLFFPDPWHKKRHNKRRIVQPDFIALIASRLKLGGVFHLATDWEPYAEHMAELMLASGEFKSLSKGAYSPKPSDRPTTKFETRGIRLGHGVWDLLFEKV